MYGLSSRRASLILTAILAGIVAGVVAILVDNALVRGLLTAAGVMVVLGVLQLATRSRTPGDR
jgi:hypothetical protein